MLRRRSRRRDRVQEIASPASPDPRLAAGLTLLRARQFQSAAAVFRRCIADGLRAEGFYHLGAAQHALGQLREAAGSFAEALASGFDAAQGSCARATVLVALGEHAEAEAELRRGLQSAPKDPQVLCNLAIVLERRGALDDALALYGRALEADPSHFSARLNRGALHLSRDEPQLALEDFDKLVGSGHPEVQVNRARSFLALHRDAEALDAADAALEADPQSERARLHRAIALASLGRLDEAQAALRGHADPSIRMDALSLYLDRAFDRLAAFDWGDRDRLVEVLRTRCDEVSEPSVLIRALALPLHERELAKLADAVARGVHRRAAADSPFQGSGPAISKAQGRIRVGLLSPEFRLHTGGFVLRQLLRHRDPARFSYHAYALDPDDGSEIRRELQGLADSFLDVSAWTSRDIAARIRSDGIDLLLDRTGYFTGMRPEVLAMHPAPVQASFLGTPCTLGKGLVDYRVSDRWTTPPESQAQWHEKLVLLPAPHAFFDPDLPRPDAGTRQQHGLQPDAIALCCFEQAHRIDPETFAIWMRLLVRQPRAILWLFDAGRLGNANLQKRAAERGVAAERLRFVPAVPYERHLSSLPHADLFLDPLNYSSRSMAFNALAAGVPVLTCAGATMASRLSGAFLHSLGLQELVTDSPDRYEEKAMELVLQPERLAALKRAATAMRKNGAPFRTAERVGSLEKAFAAMVERARAGLAPETLVLD